MAPSARNNEVRLAGINRNIPNLVYKRMFKAIHCGSLKIYRILFGNFKTVTDYESQAQHIAQYCLKTQKSQSKSV